MKPNENPEVNEYLRSLDAEQVAAGLPILSILVADVGFNEGPSPAHDAPPCSVALESIEKYGLRKPGEEDVALWVRLRDAAYLYYAEVGEEH